MKYINQRDYPDVSYITMTEMDEASREAGKSTPVFCSGCGLAAAVIVADRLLINSDFGLEDALRISYASNANILTGTRYYRFAPAFAEELGLVWETANDPEDLLRCLHTGGAAVIHTGGDREGHVGVFSYEGHFVVAVSQERDGRIALLDPYYHEGWYERGGIRRPVEVKRIKNGVLTLCDMQVIMDDSATIEPRFHLFWRK